MFLSLIGCGDLKLTTNDFMVTIRTKCIGEEIDKRATYIVACSKAANPMSDEEEEDLVSMCNHTSKFICSDQWVVAKHPTSMHQPFPCFNVLGIARKACLEKGWNGKIVEDLITKKK